MLISALLLLIGGCSGPLRETGSNYVFTQRDFKNFVVIRAIYFTMHDWQNR